MSESLIVWITSELNRLSWSHAELATRAGTSKALVSRVLGGDMAPSCDFCIRVAMALDANPVAALHLAGILPTEAELAALSPISAEIARLAETLPPDHRRLLLDFAQFLVQKNSTPHEPPQAPGSREA